MILTTTETVPDRHVVAILGLVYGNTVRSSHLGDDVDAMMKRMIGGEIEEYTKLMAEVREQALDRLIRHARERGADAVVGLKFTTTEIADGAAEFMAYGTAVKLD